jgi:hypothetical protein
MDEIEEAESVVEGEFEAMDRQLLARFDDQFAGGVVVAAGMGIAQRDAGEKAAAGSGEHDQLAFRGAEPDRTAAPPASGIDAGAAADAEPRLGGAGFTLQELLFQGIH